MLQFYRSLQLSRSRCRKILKFESSSVSSGTVSPSSKFTKATNSIGGSKPVSKNVFAGIQDLDKILSGSLKKKAPSSNPAPQMKPPAAASTASLGDLNVSMLKTLSDEFKSKAQDKKPQARPVNPLSTKLQDIINRFESKSPAAPAQKESVKSKFKIVTTPPTSLPISNIGNGPNNEKKSNTIAGFSRDFSSPELKVLNSISPGEQRFLEHQEKMKLKRERHMRELPQLSLQDNKYRSRKPTPTPTEDLSNVMITDEGYGVIFEKESGKKIDPTFDLISKSEKISIEALRKSVVANMQKIAVVEQRKKNAKPVVKKVVRNVVLPDHEITSRDLATLLSLKLNVVTEKLLEVGETEENLANPEHTIELDNAELVALDLGFSVTRKEGHVENKKVGDPKDLVPRSPIVCIMGHVDHGKTTLLDTLRKGNVAAGEAGGITQRISAFEVNMNNKRVVFLDTPGHAAFASMRQSGAQATDVVVLVVAIEDGMQPQTKEAALAAKEAGCSVIIALNKVDRIPKEDVTRIRLQVLSQLVEAGLIATDLGGTVPVVEISGKTGYGLDELISVLSQQTDILELKGNPKVPADCIVLDSRLEKGRGVLTDVIVRNGTLSVGDFIVAGPCFGKIRTMVNHENKSLKSAGPGTPVRLVGLRDVPSAGIKLEAVESEALAGEIAARKKRIEDLKLHRAQGDANNAESDTSDIKLINVILKADTPGTLLALQAVVNGIKLRSKEVEVNIVDTAIGNITTSDIEKATIAGEARILGFNVNVSDANVRKVATDSGIHITRNDVIYRLEEDLIKLMSDLLPKILVHKEEGTATVLKTFQLNDKSNSLVAGLRVEQGALKFSNSNDNIFFDIFRNGELIGEKIKAKSLKIFKTEVNEVLKGNECGLILDGFKNLKEQDTIKCSRSEWINSELTLLDPSEAEAMAEEK